MGAVFACLQPGRAHEFGISTYFFQGRRGAERMHRRVVLSEEYLQNRPSQAWGRARAARLERGWEPFHERIGGQGRGGEARNTWIETGTYERAE